MSILKKDHSVGVLITKNSVGKTFFSHEFAVNGGLVKIFIDNFNATHTLYHTEYAETSISKSLTNKEVCPGCGGTRHWEIIDLETAKEVIIRALDEQIAAGEKKLQSLISAKENTMSVIKEKMEEEKQNNI